MNHHRSFVRRATAMILGIGVVTALAQTMGCDASPGARPPAPAVAPPNESQASALIRAYGKLPISFEPNRGQTAREVDYLARGAGYTIFLTSKEMVLTLAKPATNNRAAAVLRMRLIGAEAKSARGVGPLPGRVNYFVGRDPAAWHADIPTVARVQYDRVYPGVDILYYGNQRQLEYDFVVAPGADSSAIALAFEGADHLAVGADGDLALQMSDKTMRLKRPVVYQDVGGARREIEGGYALLGGGQVGFRVGPYDATKPLVIDPVIAYASYLGGGLYDEARDIAVDASGSAYVTSATRSPDFPTASALDASLHDDQCAFVTKIDPSGASLVYSTYLGGGGARDRFGNRGRDFGAAIAVDASGAAYVAGSTTSIDFPTMSALQPTFEPPFLGAGTSFVAKLSAAGSSLVYSTYLADSTSGYSGAFDIAVDGAGSAYVAGTAYPDFLGPSDALISKLGATGSTLVYSTHIGGSANDSAAGIALDGSGNAYVTGATESADFPVRGAAQVALGGGRDAFVTKLDASGANVLYSTYLGGVAEEEAGGIAVSVSGEAYVTGLTASADFPTAHALQPARGGAVIPQDAFLTKLTAAGNTFVYSSYLGGSGYESGNAIALDAAGSAYVSGVTTSLDFPAVSAAQSTLVGGSDAFVTKIDAAGAAIVYSTYLGGSMDDASNTVAVDALGNAYIAGSTRSALDFPTLSAFQSTFGGARFPDNLFPQRLENVDAFVAKIGDSTDLCVTGAPSTDVVMIGRDVTFTLTVTSATCAPAVTLTDTLSGDLTVVSITPSQGSCSIGSDRIVCDLGAMDAGGHATVTIVVRAGQPGSIGSTATVSGVVGDTNAANDTASESVSVVPHHNVAVIRSCLPL